MILKKKNWLAILALVLAVAMLAACTPRTDMPDDDTPSRDDYDPNFDGVRIGEITPDFSYEIAERFSVSDHTVGWVDVPGTNISDVVVRNPDCTDNEYYLRRNFYGEEYFYGVYYIDIRAELGQTRDELGVVTTIYGHAMTDNPEEERFNRKFGNLHRFRDPEFMLEHPYIFFSLPEDNMAFEVIAVFYGNVDNPEFSYNFDHPDVPFIDVINNAVLPRSLYHFDIELDANDKFLVLSTCIYNPSCGTQLLHHRDTMYRFAIMARLVSPNAPLRDYATFTINENRTVDPDGRWQS
ncbi:MAG: class B sortase [Oscillospiraceae bacterium]|nr:class B sortase [Oscillospiraceae bacterium]